MAWWTLTITDKEELTDCDKQHIADLIRDGYTSGDLIDEDEEDEDTEDEEDEEE